MESANNSLNSNNNSMDLELQNTQPITENSSYITNLITLIDNLKDIIYSVDLDFNLTAFNKAFGETVANIEGKKLQIGINIYEQISSLRNDEMRGYGNRALNGEFLTFQKTVYHQEIPLYFETSLNPIFNESNIQVGVLIHSKNITDVKSAEKELITTNRELNLLNLIDEEILKTKNELDIIKFSCEMLAATGGYDLAWIGYAPILNSNNAQIVMPMANAGAKQNYLNEIQIDLLDEKLNKGPVGTTMLTGVKTIVNCVKECDNFKPWSITAEKYELKAVASFPLNIDNQTIASLNLYSSKVNFFTTREIQLLERISNNLAFAIKTIRVEKDKLATEEALIKSNERFKYVTKATFDAIWDWDLINNTHYWGEGFEKLFGYTSTTYSLEFFKWEENIHPNDRERVVKSLSNCINDLKKVNWIESYQFKKANNEYAHILDKAITLRDEYGKPTRMIGAMQDITNQINEEQRLRLYASVITNTNDGILICKIGDKNSLSTEVIFANEAFCKMTGYSSDELIEKSPFLLHGPKTSQETLEFIRINTQKCQQFEAEIINYKKDGTEFWIDFSSVPVSNEIGEFTHWISIQRDITARKVAEVEKEIFYSIIKIMNENDLLNTSFQSILEIICKHLGFSYAEAWSINFDKTRMLYRTNWKTNEQMNVMLQYGNLNEVLFGSGIAGITWKEKQNLIWNDLQKSPLNRKQYALQAGLESAIGLPIFFNGEIITILALFSENKLIDDQINASLLNTISYQLGTYIQKHKTEDELNKFFNLSPDLMCIVGFDGYFKKTNHAVSKLLGYSSSELLSKPLIEFVFEEDKTITLTTRQKIHSQYKEITFENRYVTKNGEIKWLSWTSIPIHNENLVFAVAKDITERKKMEEERKDLIQELTRSNKELKQFSYITSHNMRSPLTNLMAISELIDTSLISDNSTVELIEGFKASTIHLNETLNDLIKILIIKENTNQELEEISLRHTFDNVINSIASIINQSNAKINYNFDLMPSVKFNKPYLESILLNLTTNAIKYAHPSRTPIITVSTEVINNATVLTFEDNGIGFNEEKVKGKIFGLYQKFHNHADSKGIGLYLVQSQINALGGSIDVTSKENEGTKFIITFAQK
ncbi:MAG: PAS domain S-box protein [Candidatus Methylacidiphilales bacterium]